LVKRSWFGTYGPADLLQMERILQSWDCASKTLDTHDYSVCLTLGLKQGRIYLIDVFRAKLEMPELVRAVVELANKYGPERVLIEDKGAGIGLLQALRARYFHKGTPIIPKRDKMARFSAITPMIESGAVLLPEQAPWLDDYLHEICGFPATKHDDQIDATSQALEWIQEFASLSGIEEFTRLGSEESRASLEGRNVHLRALDIGNRPILGNGVETPLGVDGTIWVNEQDAATLRAAGYVDVAS
jgi:predicted phage terminase large subunit-like protein